MLADLQKKATSTKGHQGTVTHAILLPDNARVVTGGADGQIRIWEIVDGESSQVSMNMMRVFAAHEAELLDVSYLTNERLMTTGADGKIRIWPINEETAPPIELADIGPEISAVSISHDEKTLAVALGDEGKVQLLAVNFEDDVPAKPIRRNKPVGEDAIPEITHPARVRTLAFSADAQLLMTGCDDGVVRIWASANDKLLEQTVSQEDAAAIVSVSFPPASADRRFQRGIVVTDSAGTLKWWLSGADPRDTRRTRRITKEFLQCEMAGLSTDDTSTGATVLKSGQSPELLPLYDQLRTAESAGDVAAIREAIFSLEPESIVSESTAEKPTLAASFKTSFDFKMQVKSRNAAHLVKFDFSTDGSQLAVGRQKPTSTGQTSSTLRMWDIPTNIELRHWPSMLGGLQNLQVVGNGQNLVTLPDAVALGRSSGQFSVMDESSMMVARSPDGSRIAVGVRGIEQTLGPVVRLLDAQTLREITTFESYESYPTAMAFSPDGKTLLVSIRERKAHKLLTLDATTLQQIQLIEEHGHDQAWLLAKGIGGTKAVTLIMFSSDGRRLLTYGEYEPGTFRLSLWESKKSGWVEESDRRIEARKEAMVQGADPPARFLDARGSRLVLAIDTGYRILDLDDKRVEREIEIQQPVTKRAISSDGSLLAVGTEQGKVQLWRLDKERPMKEFSAHLGPVVSLKFTPDGSHLATIGEENVVNVWKLDDWTNKSRRLANR